jgi:hypothetical protein
MQIAVAGNGHHRSDARGLDGLRAGRDAERDNHQKATQLPSATWVGDVHWTPDPRCGNPPAVARSLWVMSCSRSATMSGTAGARRSALGSSSIS